MLHTVNKSPFEKSALEACLAHATKGSAILLIEDGVFAALQGTSVAGKVAEAMADVTIYVLGPDLAARGMPESKVIDGIKVVGYDGFVDLVAEHSACQAWL